MTVTGIDTLEVVKELKAAGFSDEQAEAVTRVVRRAQDKDTKALELRLETKVGAIRTEIDVLLSRVNTKIAATRAEFLKWMLAVALAFQTLIIIGTIAVLLRIALH